MNSTGGREPRRQWPARLAVRLGAIFACLILFVTLVVGWQRDLSERGQHLPWVMVVAAIGAAGLAGLRAGRIPGQIEAELLRTASSDSPSQSIRPLIGSGDLVETWNTLVEQAQLAERRHNSLWTHSDEALQPTAQGQDVDDQQAQLTALLARAMRSISVGIVVTDTDYQILSTNEPAERLLASGNSTEVQSLKCKTPTLIEQLTKLAWALKDREQEDELSPINREWETSSRALQQLVSGGGNLSVRLPVLVEGIVMTLRITRCRLLGRQGDRTGLVWMLQDISQQTLAEQSRDQFLHTATHELRTPLANLLAYAEALNIHEGINVEQQKEFCNIIMEETKRLSRLVDNLLAVGQLEAGSMVVGQHRVEMQRILEEAIENTRPQLVANGLTLTTDISPKLRSLRGDKDKLQTLLVNLLGNAAKYTPRGGQVHVAARMREDVIEITLQDTGIGISAEDLPKIFDKFYRVQSDQVREQAGNGLGLAFVREVARLHQGDVTVESRIGEGSIFTLRLPAPDQPLGLQS